MTAAAADDTASRDDLAMLVAIGLLAYAAADIAHHVLGHGGACLALGGRIVLLSSIFVDCTVRGSAIDLAGPFANLAVGLAALALAHHLSAASTARLFFALAAGFNLFGSRSCCCSAQRRAPTISPGRWRHSTCRNRCATG